MDLCFVHINQSTQPTPYGPLTAPILAQLADAFGSFLNEDVAPVWGGTYQSRPSSLTDGSDIGPGEAGVFYQDNLDAVPGAAAYHDRTADGRPIIYIALSQFTDFFQGSMAVSAGGGHEGAEVVGDVGANFWSDRLDGTEEALELCDRLEGTDYQKNGVMVPNFLYPSAFDPGSSGPYDKQGILTAVDGMTPGGYVILRQQGAQVAPAMSDGKKIIAVVFKLSVVVKGFDKAKMHPLALARKQHHSSRTYRRGVRL
jgi:hypothetical protein